ncbi:delta-60 repeat domain-containing protein [Pseudomonas sp. BCRC 81390]|uniref:delta-60 repeat domain-containing protein n=1 Tax=Pseudomonas sp. BCRC 81390 TaxID=3054778 RepID=UPI0025914FC0|nr:delta-60 repeat domain-containing protein [Pseudomonas sp. BCRC 81390]MDM3887171.1 delta-60 repeat domain-containing protein [Pseudomonas sp. BCRC 81390]
MSTTSKAGHLDPQFASQGRFSHSAYDHLGPITLDSNQKTLISSAPRAASVIKMLRLEPNGALDTGFGVQGVATVEYDGALRVFLTGIVTDETGRIFIVADYNYAPDSYHPMIIRLLPNGAPDTSFGEDNKAYRVYRAISSTSKDGAIKLRSDVQSQSRSLNASNSVGIWDGILYFHSRDHIVAATLAGDLATEFNGTGYWRATHDNSPVLLRAMTTSEGSIYAAFAPLPGEEFEEYVFVTRLDRHGKVDASFAEDGYLRLATPGYPVLPAVLRQSVSNQHFVLACSIDVNTYDEGTALMAFNSDGTLTDTFNNGNPVIIEKNPEIVASPNDLAFDANTSEAEKLYLAVLYEDKNLYSPFTTLRLNSDGKLDPTYGADGWAFIGESGLASSITCQPNGQLLVASNLKLPTDPRAGLYLTRLLA